LKFLLAIAAYFAILWGWRKLGAWIKNTDAVKSGTEIHEGSENSHHATNIDPRDIEEASFKDIRDE
jgi:hypothetical protein